jgi:predicted NBD/HSP70 family sugar kinase
MILVIDIGGSKTIVATLDEAAERPTVLEYKNFPTPKTPTEMRDKLVAEIRSLKINNLQNCLMGVPTSVKENMVADYYPNLPEWKDENGNPYNPAKDIAAEISAPVFLFNDADLAAYGEAAALNFPDSMVYMSIGTGLGVGVVSSGLVSTHSEAGHMMLEVGGKIVEWEKIASGTAITRDYGKAPNEIDDPEVWKMISARLALGIGLLVPIFNPDFVVLGGGVSTNFDKFADFLPALVAKRLAPQIDVPPIVKASDPYWAVIYGGFYYGKILIGK